MTDCLFCKIISGEIPSNNKIYEDDVTIALLDINPVSAGHTLVIPKRHSKDILEIEDVDLGNISLAVKNLSKIIKDKLNATGVLIHMDGRDIPHTHVHIIPRYTNKELQLLKGAKSYKSGEMEKYVKLLTQK